MRVLSAAIPPEHRGTVMSAFYLVAYTALSVPAILAGVLTTPFSLHPNPTCAEFDTRADQVAAHRPGVELGARGAG